MFMPLSSRNMQKGCHISCCQMIMAIFFGSGERSLRIWVFSFDSDQGQVSERGSASDTEVVLFLDVSVYPTSVMTISLRGSEPTYHSTCEQICYFMKPKFYEILPLSATSFLREKDKTSCKPPCPPCLISRPWQWASVECQITGKVMIMWRNSKMLWLSDLVLRSLLLVSKLKTEQCPTNITTVLLYRLIRSARCTVWCELGFLFLQDHTWLGGLFCSGCF